MRFWKGWCGERDSADVKAYKRIQMIALRKAGGIVRFWKGWCGASDGGVAIPPVVARFFSGDSTSPLAREASVMVRGEGLLSFCNGCEDDSIRCNGKGKQGK